MHFDNAEAERSNFSAGSLAQLQRYQNAPKQLFLFFYVMIWLFFRKSWPLLAALSALIRYSDFRFCAARTCLVLQMTGLSQTSEVKR